MRLDRLAPIAFVLGVLLFGLSILALTFNATAPGFGPVEEHETTVVDEDVLQAYPVPVSRQVATRIDVTFEYPRHAGDAMIVGCSGYSALLQGQDPDRVHSSSSGDRGSISTGTSPEGFRGGAPDPQCPFLYAVLQWELRGEEPTANQPEATVTSSPVIMPGLVLTVAGVTAVIGIAIALLGGTAWSRRLQRVRGTVAAGDDESTSETLLHAIGKTGDWLTRTRRYVILAGILGIFLWYPVVLPWAWTTSLRGSSTHFYPWLLSFGALTLLLILTIFWAREYLRLDRELVAWRKRMDRFHKRETQLLADLDASG